MVDTIKILTAINYQTYITIKNFSIVKTSYHSGTGEIYYNIINDKLEGSYNSSLSVRIGDGLKYNLRNEYYIEIEGSYHKIKRGYNSHNGFYNPADICWHLIQMVEDYYSIKLPSLRHWFLQRIDIAICYDLKSQENVTAYINNLNCCNFPRRKLKHYEEESLYLTGSTTTLKIYNKSKEFQKHDMKKLMKSDFDISSHLEEIKGFIRFECEIKKRKLTYYYRRKFIRITTVTYAELKEIFYLEFKKFFKMIESDFNIISNREEVKQRLHSVYSKVRAMNLYNFYLLVIVQGLQEVKRNTNRSMYYKNISDLKKANVDFSQKLNVDLNNQYVEFNPFEQEEVL